MRVVNAAMVPVYSKKSEQHQEDSFNMLSRQDLVNSALASNQSSIQGTVKSDVKALDFY